MNDEKFYAGLDIGSVSIKAAIMQDGRITASGLIPSGGNYRNGAASVMDDTLSRAGITFDHLSGLVVTGLGADSSPYPARQVSDISCHARGCRFTFPSAKTVIDIGGQFTRAAKMTPEGRITDFLMSEKCATGSGRFIQVISRILQVPLDEIGPLSLQSENPVEFSTNCAVFAESETISRIAEGEKPADILAGVHRAMAVKVAMLVKRLKVEPDVALTGGGGQNEGLVRAVSKALKMKVLVPPQPRLTAAIGAALLAST